MKSRTQIENKTEQGPVYRARCYRCYRPETFCFCDQIPSIDNRTNVLIIQDRRERFHAFNTARIVDAALRDSRLITARQSELKQMQLPIRPGAGILFPGKDARLLEELAPDERPRQLVVLDGTWHHAKQLYRHLPQLQSIPRFMIQPEQPGNYRIRKEPNDTALSTVEATVEAMRALEPETDGWDALIGAFTYMIDAQIAHPKSEYGMRYNRKRFGTPYNIPSAIVHRFEDVVVAYGESNGIYRRDVRNRDHSNSNGREPVYWVAERPATGECFGCAIRAGSEPVDATVLDHLELSADEFDDAVSVDEFRTRWAEFLDLGVGRESSIAVYNQSTIDLLAHAGAVNSPSIVLKCIDLENGVKNGSLPKKLETHGLEFGESHFPGRAGVRLAGAITLTRFFQSIVHRFNEGDQTPV